MNGVEIFLTAGGGLITALGGFEFVKYLLNKGSNDRIMAAQAFQEERKAIIEDYHRVQQEVDSAKEEIRKQGEKIDELYKRVRSLESERLNLIKENNELRLALKEAEHNICVRPDDECLKRLPPRMYCRLKNLAAGKYDEYYTDADKKDEADDEKDKKNSSTNQSQPKS